MKFSKKVDNTYEFRIYRHVEPKEIANLWSLEVKGPTDKEFVKVVDADSLSTCLGKVSYVFEADGL